MQWDRPEEQSKSITTEAARDYVKMARQDFLSGTGLLAMRPLSPEADEARSVAQPSHPAKSAHKVLTPDLVNSHYHVAFRECPP